MDGKTKFFCEAELYLEGIRKKNLLRLQENKKLVYRKIPRISEIDSEIKRMGTACIGKALKHSESISGFIGDFKERLLLLGEEKSKLLKEGGFPEDFLEPVFSCVICRDKGVVNNRHCKCKLDFVRGLVSRESGLDMLRLESLASFNLDYYDKDVVNMAGGRSVSAFDNAKYILDTALKFCDCLGCGDVKNLLFSGDTGLGKTFLSGCIAREFIDKGKLVCYMSAPRMFSLLEDVKFGRESSFEAKNKILFVYESDLLIIDDLGTEFRSVVADTNLFDIINCRLNSELRTVISTNMDADSLLKVYSERIGSRLLGEYKIIKFFGSDIRLKKAVGGG